MSAIERDVAEAAREIDELIAKKDGNAMALWFARNYERVLRLSDAARLFEAFQATGVTEDEASSKMATQREVCKSCETRRKRGLDGQCPACANERERGKQTTTHVVSVEDMGLAVIDGSAKRAGLDYQAQFEKNARDAETVREQLDDDAIAREDAELDEKLKK